MAPAGAGGFRLSQVRLSSTTIAYVTAAHDSKCDGAAPAEADGKLRKGHMSLAIAVTPRVPGFVNAIPVWLAGHWRKGGRHSMSWPLLNEASWLGGAT